VCNHSIPKTTYAPSIGRRYRGIVNVVFWGVISIEGQMPWHLITTLFPTMTVKGGLGEMGRWWKWTIRIVEYCGSYLNRLIL